MISDLGSRNHVRALSRYDADIRSVKKEARIRDGMDREAGNVAVEGS